MRTLKNLKMRSQKMSAMFANTVAIKAWPHLLYVNVFSELRLLNDVPAQE
jgi:hypothetical protein